MSIHRRGSNTIENPKSPKLSRRVTHLSEVGNLNMLNVNNTMYVVLKEHFSLMKYFLVTDSSCMYHE